MKGCWKTGGIFSSIVLSVLVYGITCKFLGFLEALLKLFPMLKNHSLALVLLKLSSSPAGVFGSKGMVGSSRISDQLSGDGSLALSMRSPCLSIE
jgi:hypothetical protein